MLETIPGKIVGSSADTVRLRQFVENAAVASDPVTLFGEPGTGKQLAAKLIHEASPREEAPFLMIDCSLYYERELKRELFGYRTAGENGKACKKGLFEFARKGTCYLSHIEELSPGIQAELLNFLQDGRFCRLGDKKQRTSEVRLVVSSEKNLGGFVEAGLFNRELYTQLSGLNVYLPPLRDRKEDIPALIDFFTQVKGVQGVAKSCVIVPEALEALESYPWPSNADDLRKELERLSGCGLQKIEPEHLTTEIASYWMGQRGDSEVREVLEELDAYIREFRVMSRLASSFGELLGMDDNPYHANVSGDRDIFKELE